MQLQRKIRREGTIERDGSPAPCHARRLSDVKAAIGSALRRASTDEVSSDVRRRRDELVEVLRTRATSSEYQQLMEIAGVDYPERPSGSRSSITAVADREPPHPRQGRDRRDTPVPSVTALWPVAGWLEREVFDMYGVTSPAIRTCAGSSPTMGSRAIRSARISR
jgi:NADH-quinone oxidoreductase subunit C